MNANERELEVEAAASDNWLCHPANVEVNSSIRFFASIRLDSRPFAVQLPDSRSNEDHHQTIPAHL